jgi:hypothetical protein
VIEHADLITGLIQWLAGFFVLLHAATAWRVGRVIGVNPLSLWFFAAASAWFAYLFMSLGMTKAAACAVFALACDLIWLGTYYWLRDDADPSH